MNKLTLHLIKGLTGIDIEELENSIDVLQTKNQQLSFLIKDANKEVSYKRTQLSDAQKQLSKSEDKIKEQLIAIAAQQQEIAILQKDSSGLLKTVASLQTKLEQQLHTSGLQEKEITDQKGIIDRLSEQILSVRQQAQKAEEENQLLAVQLEQLREKYALLETTKEEQAKQITTLTHTASEHSQLKQVLQATEQEREGHKATIHAQQQENQSLQNELEALRTQLTQVESNKQEALKEIQEWQRKYTNTQQSLAQSEQENTTLEKALDELRKELQLLKEEKEKTTQTLSENLSKEEMSRNKEVTQLKENIFAQQQQNQNLQQENELLQAQLSQAKDREQKTQKEVQEWQNKYTDSQESLAQSEQEKAVLEKHVASLKEEFQQLKQEKEEKVKALSESLEKEETNRNKEIAQLEENLTAQQQENQKLQQEVELLHTQLSQVEKEHNRTTEEVQQWQKQYTDILQTLNQSVEDKAVLEKNIVNLKEELQQSKQEQINTESNLNQAIQDKTALEKDCAELQEELQQLKQEKEEAVKALQENLNKENESPKKEDTQTEGNDIEDTAEQNQPEDTTSAGTENEIEEAPINEQTEGQNELTDNSKKIECKEEAVQPEINAPEENRDLLQAYQDMKAKLEKSTLHYPYTRVTTMPNGSQYIYESKNLQVKTELFTWGIEGKEVILDEPHFIAHDEISRLELLVSTYMNYFFIFFFFFLLFCREIAETLLMAICSYHPLHITYRDKNGRSSERNLYWVCFQPQNKNRISLPYEGLFNDMLEGELDSEHILAMHAHHQEARAFTITQIQSIQIFDAFVTTQKGIDTLINGLYISLLASQPEAAEMIYQCLPSQFKEKPQVISRWAHYNILTGDYEKAMELYLSIAPDAHIDSHFTWQQFNGNAFDEFIEKGVENESFEQLKEALREEGWEI